MNSKIFLVISTIILFCSSETFAPTLPSTLSPTITIGPRRTVNFSGREWWVKAATTMIKPGPNFFSNTAESVYLDENGYLHLKIRKQGDYWISSEINSLERFGYGTFSFVLGQGFDTIDLKAGVGLFIYTNDTNQIDLQVSQWYYATSNNSYYVIQPTVQNGSRISQKFNLSYADGPVVSSITLTPTYVLFQSFNASSIADIRDELGKRSNSSLLLREYYYDGPNIPLAGNLAVCLNYWLHNKKGEDLRSPLSGLPSQVVVRQFDFKPYS